MGAALLLAVGWPGDVKWVNDEPTIIYRAWQANQEGRLATAAERVPPGHLGVSYHQVGIWYYQLFLALTGGLLSMVLLKGLVAAGLTLGGAWVLCRQTGLSRWLALLSIVAPLPWLQNRQLWDNVQLIPLGLWLGVCLVDMVKHRRARGWYGGLAVAVWMAHIHLMSMMVLAAWGLAVLLLAHGWLRKQWWHAVIGLVLAACTAWPFAMDVWQGISNRPPAEVQRSLGDGLAAALMGWQALSAHTLAFWVPEIHSPWFLISQPLTGLLAGLTWLVLPLLALGAWQVARRWPGSYRRPTPRDAMSCFAALAILTTSGAFLLTRTLPLNHYNHGVWFAWLWLAWLGIRWCAHRRWGRWLAGSWMGATIALVVLTALFLHRFSGTRELTYGPSLGTQLAAVRQVVAYEPPPRSELINSVDMYRIPQLQHALRSLLLIVQNDRDTEPRTAARITLYHADDLPPIAGAIRVDIEPLPEAPAAAP